MQDQACLNRLAQPDFVSQKHAWRQARRNFGGNVKLVRKQIDASPEKTTHCGFTPPVLVLEGCCTAGRRRPGRSNCPANRRSSGLLKLIVSLRSSS